MSHTGALPAQSIAGLLVLALAGCDRAVAPDPPAGPVETAPPSDVVAAAPANGPGASRDAAPESLALRPAGYDTIRIGAPPSEAEGYALADDGSYEDSCRIHSSDRLANFYAIVEDGRVMRLTAFHRPETGASPVRTDRGIGVGSTEAEVRAAYSPLREQPHHYVGPPAKDLFFGGSEREPGLRFEMGEDGKVSALHAGLMPVLAYVEGCS